MSRPAVSVLLPVRDAAATLPECIDSLRAQTLREHEVVAVDDGSTDGSGALLEQAAAGDRRWRVVPTPPRGLVAALETARELARADVLARMDADDVCHPERLARQAGWLRQRPGTDVLGCGVELVGGRDNRGMLAYVAWLNALQTHEQIAAEIFVESPLAHPAVMLRAALLRSLGGWREIDGPEDYDLWLRAYLAGARFASLPSVLLRWRDGPGRLTRTDPRYAEDRFFALKLDALERGPLRERPGVVVWGAGPIGKRWGLALIARGHELRAWADVHPRRLGTHLHGRPVLDAAAAARIPGAVHLAAVGQPGGRARIRAEAARHGLRDGADLWAVA